MKINAEILKKLAALAEEVGATVETPNDKLLLYSDHQHSEPPVASIPLDQPQRDVIFAFLREISRFTPQIKNTHLLRMPWFINRPFENETVGEIAYKTRRAVRQKCGKAWQADFWAMTVFPFVGTKDDMKAFLEQHPEKRVIYLCALAGHVTAKIQRLFHRNA
jgi:hypothetical protein